MQTILGKCHVAACVDSVAAARRGDPSWKHFRMLRPDASTEDGEAALDAVALQFGRANETGHGRARVNSLSDLDRLNGGGGEQRYIVMLREPTSWAVSDAEFRAALGIEWARALHRLALRPRRSPPQAEDEANQPFECFANHGAPVD